jgi:hypothetical protein
MRAGCPLWRKRRPRGPGVVSRIALPALIAFCCSVVAADAATPLRTIVEDVPGSTGYRYGTKDNFGNSMDTLKIVKSPFGGYIGVYHTYSGDTPTVKVATSQNLLYWTFEANLAHDSSHATIYNLPRGGSLVAYESLSGCPEVTGNCIALKYYLTESALLNGVASRTLVLRRKLSSCAEGTPSITSATSTLSSIQLSFHYFSNCYVDRQGRGTLQGFDAAGWSASTAPSIDQGILSAGASADGSIGDRDAGFYDGASQRLYEGQLAHGDSSSWRNFLWAGTAATKLDIRTHGGSVAFANPTYTPLTLPSGQSGVVVTQFIPQSGAAPGEAGELVYYRPRDPAPPPPPGPDPTIAAAGDISCTQDTTCHDDETSGLLVADPPTRVLTLGDNQYESGELVNFNTYYQPDWGRLKPITLPSPGNHDPPSSGYGAYFGMPVNYSFDVGTWHLISLNSTSVAAATTFLDSDLATHSNRCMLAYWHHPRFSSGATHGNNSATAPFWDRLYAAGADVILNGHDHIYERFAPQTPAAVASPAGIREFVVGTGGRALHQLGTVRANSEVRFAGRYGVLRITLHPTSYDWRFQGEDGQTYDSGSTDCS